MRYDLLIIGGGINGAGIARDAAGRGLSVVLCEQDDLASHTSGASTKLIHGGLRYLEFYEFSLVRKALQEREVLLRIAPHIVRPLRFVVPHDPRIRPAWMVRAGLLLYDHLARRVSLPASDRVDLRDDPLGECLQAEWTHAFRYSDCWVEDARLVVLNAMDAAARGAHIHTRCKVVSAQRSEEHWSVTLAEAGGGSRELEARAIVNAAGPWVSSVLGGVLAQPQPPRLRLVKGSHIVVPRLFAHDSAYLFQNPDRRIIFALPFAGAYTLIGTTELEFDADPASVAIDAAEVEYLCTMATRYFRSSVTPAHVVASFSGVRPLLDDEASGARELTRDYALQGDARAAPLLNVLGGKITTYRRLAEDALAWLLPELGHSAAPWTATVALPGGDLPSGAADYARSLTLAHPWLPSALAQRWAHSYGSLTTRIIAEARSLAELGAPVIPGLHEAELRYLVREEWARSAADVLCRRTRLGLGLDAAQQQRLAAWLIDEGVA